MADLFDMSAEVERLGAVIRDELTVLQDRIVRQAVVEAQRRAPVDTGQYRASISGSGGRIRATAPHARFVEARKKVLSRAVRKIARKQWTALKARVRRSHGR